jgi:hypothetical protein
MTTEGALAGGSNLSSNPPMLAGFLVDVSGSMLTAMRSRSGGRNRLQSFQDSFDKLVERATRLADERSDNLSHSGLNIFAYGFGFGNPVAMFLNPGAPSVRDLLDLGHRDSTVSAGELAANLDKYRRHIESLASEMFGGTPMVLAFSTARDRFASESRKRNWSQPQILFVLSDGEPTGGPSASTDVITLANELKRSGILVVSCFLSDEDVAEHRRLYASQEQSWSKGAKLMFECASEMPPDSPFEAYLLENEWEVENGARLFAQINQSEMLSEFLSVIASPLRLGARNEISSGKKVFVSYSRLDADWRRRLDQHLKPLIREGLVDYWCDDKVKAGSDWMAELQEGLRSAKVVILLVSSNFFASDFIAVYESPEILKAAKTRGTIVLPIIINPSRFERSDFAVFQTLNPPSTPLAGMKAVDQEELLEKAVQFVEHHLK